MGIRAPLKGNAAYVGMELQVLDNTAPKYAKLKPWQYHGSIYGIVPARTGYLNPPGEWNHETIVAIDDHVMVRDPVVRRELMKRLGVHELQHRLAERDRLAAGAHEEDGRVILR